MLLFDYIFSKGSIHFDMSTEQFLTSRLGIEDPALAARMAAAAHTEVLPRGTLAVTMGQPLSRLLILEEGVLRGYVMDEDGHDFTDCFVCHPGDVIAGCAALDQPSPVNVETLTDCRVLVLPIELLRELLRTSALLQVYTTQLSNALTRHWEIKMMLYRPAMERYCWFLRNYPGLEEVVSGKHLASFLGITPVTLSRLRRRKKSET